MTASSRIKVAAAQVGAIPFDVAATLGKLEKFVLEAKRKKIRLLVFPEALLGGYPKGWDFGARVGLRTGEGRDQFRRYWQNAIACPGPETKRLAKISTDAKITFVVGVIERDGGTLYCTTLTFAPNRGLVQRHRKLMPTASERLIWGQGDGSTISAIDTDAGRIGSAICWENYMPMYRQFLYANGVQIWCASTVDEREMWRVSMRHIAYEGRCFVISACQFVSPAAGPGRTASAGSRSSEDLPIRGGSMIVSPFGEVLAGPLENGEGLVAAEIDLNDIPRGKYDLDVTGHYARPDIFRLFVNRESAKAVEEATRSPKEPQF